MLKKALGGIALSIAMTTGVANAATQADRTITGTGCDSNGTCYANITPAATTTCTNPNQVRWNGTDTAGKNFTAAALTAKASEATVNIGTVDGECNGQFAKVNFITIK